MAFPYMRKAALAFTLFFIGHLRAGPLLTEPYPSPHASFNSSGLPVGADVYPDANSPGLLQHGSGSSFEDPFDFKKKHPPRLFFDDSGDVFFISFAVLQELAASLLSALMAEGHETLSEPVDGNGGSSRQGNQGNPPSGQNSGGIRVFVRGLWNCFCGCFTGSTGGDDEDPDQRRQHFIPKSHYLDYDEISLTLASDDDYDDDTFSASANDDSPVDTASFSPGPQAITVSAEINDDFPETQAPQDHSLHQGYTLISNNVFHSTSGDIPDHLNPADNQEVVFVYLGQQQQYIPVLVNITGAELACAICQSLLVQPVRLNCIEEHSFCQSCVTQHTEHSEDEKKTCPLCRMAFSSSEPNQGLRRQIANLAITCPWCSQSSSISEAAAHLANCEQQPINCANCQSLINSNEFNAHLQSCTSDRPALSQLSEAQVRLLAEQLAKAYGQAIVPNPAQSQPQFIRLANRVVLQPLTGSPEVFTRTGAQGIEFYARVDLSRKFAQDGIGYKLVSCKPTQGDTTFKIKVYATFYQAAVKCNTVKFTFGYKSPRQLPGDWQLHVFDFNGDKIDTEEEIIFAEQEFEDGECVIFHHRVISYSFFNRNSPFWNRPGSQRISYIRIKFTPK